jgi:arylsulfatase
MSKLSVPVNSEFSRRRFIRTAALGSANVIFAPRLQSQPAKLPYKPNLLIFLPDQLRADAIIGENASSVHAPNVHKLASQSVAFERTYVTQPICAPSRSSLLSGTWPHLNGCTNNKGILPRKFLCLPEMVADSDYRTGYFGKWHLGDEFSAQHGFQEWVSLVESFKSVEREHHALRWRRTNAISDYTKFLLSKGYQPDVHRGKYFSSNFASNLPFEFSKPKFLETRACDFLDVHGREPFLMIVAFLEPHEPYNGPFNDEHSVDMIQLEPSADDGFGQEIPLRSRLIQEFYREKLNSRDRYREIKKNYFGLISEIDRCIGTILAKLENIGVSDRTILILTSDHGDMMSAHGILGKQLMFEQSARVPYLIGMPRQQRSVRVSQPISHIDFAPTMLDLLGKTPNPQCVGKSRAALIRGETMPPEPVFIEWAPGKEKINEDTKLASKEQIKQALGESTRAIVTPDGWKLCLRDKDKNELYNLHEDTQERQNLYYDNSYRAVIQKLKTEIYRWQGRVGDKLKV